MSIFWCWRCFSGTKPLGLKTFRNTPEKAKDSAVLAANQGLYNGFLAAGLVWGLIHTNPGFAFQIKVFFLLCVIVAGAYGARDRQPPDSVCAGGARCARVDPALAGVKATCRASLPVSFAGSNARSVSFRNAS